MQIDERIIIDLISRLRALESRYSRTEVIETGTGSGSGDVVGPASATDNAVARFDGATGKLIKDSVVIVTDLGLVSGVAKLTIASDNLGPLDIVNTRAGGYQFTLRSLPAANSQIGDTIDYAYNIKNSAGVEVQAALMRVTVVSPTAGSYATRYEFITSIGGAIVFAMYITDKVGVNVSNPAARLHVLESTLGNEVLRLTSTATNDDPRESTFQNRVTTTNNTITTIATIPIPASTTVGIEAKVTVRRTGGTSGTAEDGGFFGKAAAFKNVAGVATIIGAVTDIWADIESQAWSVTIVSDGAGNALIRVTGTTDNNLTWHVTYRTYPVGS
jgi:hypothetical protein